MPTGKDILWWIEKYENKLGGSFFRDWDFGFYPLVHVFEDGSLFTYTICDGRLEVGPASFEFWKAWDTIAAIAKALGFTEVATITPRKAKAYARFVKCKHIKTKVIGGKEYHYMIKEVE